MRYGSVLFVLVLMIPRASAGQSSSTGNYGPNVGGAVAGAFVAAGAVTAGGIYLAVHHSHTSLSGCVHQTDAGLVVITNSGTHYELQNDPAGVQAGERLSFRGHRINTVSGHSFQVDRVSGHHGACSVM